MANAALGDLYSGGVAMSKDDLSTEYLTRAFNLRNSVSEREKLYLAALYYEDAARELDKAVESYELWKWTYPRDAQPYSDLAGVFNELGRYQNAVDNAKQAILLKPDHNFAYQRLATAYFGLNRWSEAKAICDDAVAKKLDGPNIHWRLYTIAFIEGDGFPIHVDCRTLPHISTYDVNRRAISALRRVLHALQCAACRFRWVC